MFLVLQAHCAQLYFSVVFWNNGISVSPGRPKKLFVLVNPFGGKGTGSKIYRDEVKPILEDAEIDVTLQGGNTFNRCRLMSLVSLPTSI